MLIDTHCHMDFPEFEKDREEALKRAGAAGIEALVNVGSSLKGSRAAVELSLRYPSIFASVGIHPHDAKECDEGQFLEVKTLLVSKKVVAIGEVGLDYYRNLSEPKKQVEVFKRFIGLAVDSRLPLIIHSRQAEEDTLAILRESMPGKNNGVVIHCFSGGIDFLKKCLDLGFFVSFTCNVTYKKAQGLREVVGFVPLDRMFLETDAPFLAPEGKRGQRNEPAFLVQLAQEVARIKGLDLQEVSFQTSKNAKGFFHLP